MKALLLAAALLGACHKGDGAILVSVGASQTVMNVAALHVTMTVGSAVHTHDVTLGGINIDDAHRAAFGIVVSADIGSTMRLQVDAQDSMRGVLASGEQAGIAIAGGKSTQAAVELEMANCTVDKSSIENCVIAQ
jgi:hypothetical protein